MSKRQITNALKLQQSNALIRVATNSTAYDAWVNYNYRGSCNPLEPVWLLFMHMENSFGLETKNIRWE